MNADRFILEIAASYSAEMIRVVGNLPLDPLLVVVNRLEEARIKGQTVFTCGNGGSAATASHFASDLSKSTLTTGKKPVKAMSLCDNVSLVTAWANDVAFDQVFAQRLVAWVKPGDVLVAISGSGNSRNVLNAVEVAAAAGSTTIGLTGSGDGKLRKMVDLELQVPSNNMQRIEDVHLILCHLITVCLCHVATNGEETQGNFTQPVWPYEPRISNLSAPLSGQFSQSKESHPNGEEDKSR